MSLDQYQIDALTHRVAQLELIVADLIERVGGYQGAFLTKTPQQEGYPANTHHSQPTGSPIPGVPDDVIAAILARNKILAIKKYREYTGLGLREAKEAVDAFTIQLRMK